jgi:hypothetical protein
VQVSMDSDGGRKYLAFQRWAKFMPPLRVQEVKFSGRIYRARRTVITARASDNPGR